MAIGNLTLGMFNLLTAQVRYVFADACILVSLFLRRDIQMINTS